MNDKHEAEKAEAKNNVEEYVYEMRDKVYSKYEQYVAEEVRTKSCSLYCKTMFKKIWPVRFWALLMLNAQAEVMSQSSPLNPPMCYVQI